jgi:hypothetical protein
MKQTRWNGTESELHQLVNAVARNCVCGENQAPPWRCAAHIMLFDQRAVDGLVFARRIVKRLLVEEFMERTPAHPSLVTAS